MRTAGLKAEHGLSLLIEIDRSHLLFDTGASALFLGNAKHLGLSLSSLDGIILSHNHYDHTGGIEHLIGLYEKTPPIYAHPDVFRQSYVPSEASKTGSRAIGFTYARGLPDLERRGLIMTVNQEPLEVMPGVHLSGQIPRHSSIEDTGGKFFRDPELKQRDTVPDDQCLVLDTSLGLLVILGCCHSGVLNTLQRINKLWPGRPLHGLVGGLHLLHASRDRIRRTVSFLRGQKPRLIAAGHCTGLEALCALKASFGERVQVLSVGKRIRVPG